MPKKRSMRFGNLREVTAYGLAGCFPFCLMLSHFSAGDDLPAVIILFGLAIIVSFSLALVFSRFEDVTPGMATIALIFLTWFAFGLFGPLSQSSHEIMSLATAAAVLGGGFIIGKRADALSWAWSCLVWSLLIFVSLALFSHMNTRLGFDFTAGFGSANTAATLMGIGLLLAGAKLVFRLQDRKMARLTRPERINRLVQKEFPSLILLILGSIALVLTVSRAGIFISLSALVLLVGFELRRVSSSGRFRFMRRKSFWIPASIVVGSILFLAITGEINPSESELLLTNSSSRLQMFDTYASIWAERPWFGYGLGSFNELNDRHTNLQNAAVMVPIGAAHNVILQWLLQQGIIGLTMMIIVFGIIFYPILKSLASPARAPRSFLRLSIAMTILVFAHGMVDFALEIPSVMWTYAYVLGLAAGFATTTTRKRTKPVE